MKKFFTVWRIMVGMIVAYAGLWVAFDLIGGNRLPTWLGWVMVAMPAAVLVVMGFMGLVILWRRTVPLLLLAGLAGCTIDLAVRDNFGIANRPSADEEVGQGPDLHPPSSAPVPPAEKLPEESTHGWQFVTLVVVVLIVAVLVGLAALITLIVKKKKGRRP